MFDISYSADKITFVNTKTLKAEGLDLFDPIDDLDAIRILDKEFKGRESASRGSVSLLTKLLNNPRLDGYKGSCPIHSAVPAELRQAIRDLETEYYRPLVESVLTTKGVKPAAIEQAYQTFAKGLRDGGSYANTKSRVTAYFAHVGKLPQCDNGKLLTVAAMDKILQNVKEQAGPSAPSEGIAGKLVKLSLEVKQQNEKTDMGDYSTAIAALNSMLDTYIGLRREVLEKMTEVIGNNSLDSKVSDVLAKAMKAPEVMTEDTEESLTTAWNAGEIDDNQFSAHMSAIGIDVEINVE